MKTILVLKQGKFITNEVKELTLLELQKMVDGHIRQVSFLNKLNDRGIECWVNEEGKILNLDLSAIIFSHEECKIIDLLAGNIVFNKNNSDTGLTYDDIKFIKDMFGNVAVIEDINTKKQIQTNVVVI